MAHNLLPFFNAFSAALETLKTRCGDDPGRLELLVTNDDEARKTVGWMYFEANRFNQLKSQKRYIEGVPPWFIDCFNEYRARWADAVDGTYGGLTMEVLFSPTDTVNGLTFEEIYNPRPSHLKEDVRVYEAFLPGVKRGAEAIENVISNVYETFGLDAAEDSADGNDLTWMLEGVEAWDFFHKEVHIDFAGIEARWQALPRALIPTHLQKGDAGGRYDGVTHLLNDAVNAYLAGALVSSVVTCRTIVEDLLKTAYVPHKMPIRPPSPSLESVIEWALQEPDRQWMWQLGLQNLRRFANTVVHKPARAAWGKDAEAKVVKFLQAVAVLIERAPVGRMS